MAYQPLMHWKIISVWNDACGCNQQKYKECQETIEEVCQQGRECQAFCA